MVGGRTDKLITISGAPSVELKEEKANGFIGLKGLCWCLRNVGNEEDAQWGWWDAQPQLGPGTVPCAKSKLEIT